MKLLVDIGNTRVKWACAEGDILSGHNGFIYTRDTLAGLLASHWHSLAQPEQVCIASVADTGTTAEVLVYTRKAWSLEPRLAVTEKERAGLTNAYAEVSAMGVDRWLAMLAAWNRYKRPVCVIDCGTAITVDIILEDGLHAGGFILPGLSLMASTLERKTHGIRKHHEMTPELELGRSTSDCISNGFAFALAGLVERCAAIIREQEGIELSFVITGGWAEQALPFLPAQSSHEPHIVLEGLSLIP